MNGTMVLHSSLWVVLLVVMVLATGCGSSQQVKLTVEDDGGAVTLESGQTLVITLEGNPTTGYTWEAAEPVPDVLKAVGEVEFKPDSRAVGSGGKQTLRFEAVQAGTGTLELVYHRPWETEDPLETFTVEVTVQ